jgi:hypothetical protein
VNRLLDQNRRQAAQIAALDSRLKVIESSMNQKHPARHFSVGSKTRALSKRKLEARNVSALQR